MTARDALRAMRERADAATEGPWEAADYLVMASDIDITDCQIRPDAEFIAHARTDVPALVKALEAVLEALDAESTAAAEARARLNTSYREGVADATDRAQQLAERAIETALEA